MIPTHKVIAWTGIRANAKSVMSAAALCSPPFPGAKACNTPAATAAAKKKALAARETSGQERAAALDAVHVVACTVSPLGVGASRSCAAATVGGDGNGDGVGERWCGDLPASDSVHEGSSDGSRSSSESRGGGSGNN
eukprot:6179653-Pleurochrysis_carterae.AAC.1